jgi:hypothetical protein
MPGVIGLPSTPVNGGRAWGVGASGTAGCCWARAAGRSIGLKFTSATSAIAVNPSFTGILQSSVVGFQPSVKTDRRGVRRFQQPIFRG